METALELCTKLGYCDADDASSASLAKTLLDDLKDFTSTHRYLTDADTLTTLYLDSPDVIFKHRYHWTLDGSK